jgi:Dolichyl-phosphate-mannose-protein mannosyltransferase
LAPKNHNRSPAGAVPGLGPRGERLVLAVLLLVAAGVRLWRLDLMEFKADEAQACQLALQVVDGLRGRLPAGHGIPLVGLRSSVGVPNPPLFIYLLALPLTLWRDPLAAAVFIALSNVAAVGICFAIGRRYFSPFVALAATALYALAPWAVIFSRKIWAQDLLPVFIAGFLLAAHAFLVDRRPRALAWLLALAAAAVQLHFSALILGGALLGLLIAGRSVVRARWLAIGAGAAFLLCAPYLLHLARTQGGDFAHLGAWRNESSSLVPAGQRLRLALRYPLSVSGADETEVLVGAQAGWVLPFAGATGLAALGGLIWLCVRDRRSPSFSARLMGAIWFLLPTLGLIATGAVPFIHYFIILYPLIFLGLAAALESLRGRWSAASWGLLAVCLGGYAWLDAGLGHLVITQGGAPADYGAGYAHKAAAIAFVLADSAAYANQAAGPRVALEDSAKQQPILTDVAHPGGVPAEYRFLLELQSGGRRPATGGVLPLPRYFLVDSLRFTLTPAGQAGTKNLRHREFRTPHDFRAAGPVAPITSRTSDPPG